MLLQLEQVTKTYGESGTGHTVLREISINVEQGASIAVVGPSGSGKSTLLNIMGSLDRPSGGKVTLKGRDLAGLNDRDLATVRNREIGFVFQDHHLLPQCSVLENVLLPTLAGASKGSTVDTESHARELLNRVGLEKQIDQLPGTLSGGERQRAAVVRALVNRPGLLLADEPTGSLDKATAEQLADLLVDLNRKEHVALVVVTHSMSLAERMQTQYQLENGRLEECQSTGRG